MENGRRCAVSALVFGAWLGGPPLNNRLAALAAREIEQRGAAATARHGGLRLPVLRRRTWSAADGLPAGARRCATRLVAADAFIIASPEYNASMPGGLKNTIDWVSRFRPQPFNGRQGLLMSASPSMAGGNRGLWSLRIPLEHLGARVYPDMFSLAQAHQAFDATGRIADATLRQRFERTIECFLDLVEAGEALPALKKQWVEFLGERPDAAIDRVELSPVVAV